MSRLVFLVIAILLFLLDALGIDSKWSVSLFPLGGAFFAAAFLDLPTRIGRE